MESDEYKEGYEAFCNGYNMDYCPYSDEDFGSYADWKKGWIDARRELEG